MVLRSYLTHLFGMASRGGDVSTSAAGKVSTEQEPLDDIVLSKEQFNVGLCFLLPSLFKQFLYFTKIPPTFLHPNVVRILMGYSILNMLYHLDLSLLEVLFIYTIKMSGKEIFSLFAHIPSLQLVTGLLDSTKGATKGIDADVHYLVYCRKEKERSRDFTDRSKFAIAVSRFPVVRCPFHSLPCFSLRVLVPEEHYMVKDLPLYEEARAVDAKARQGRLTKRKNKSKEGILRQAPGMSRLAFSSIAHPFSKKKSDSTDLPSLEGHLDQELEPVVPCISLEPKEEEDEQMDSNLRTDFKERQRKHLSEALPATPPPAKQSRPKAPHEEPVFGRPHGPDTCPVGDEVPTATPGGNAKEKDTSVIPSSWEEIAVLLKAGSNPRMAGVVRPSHVTSNFALRYTYPLMKYTVEENAEVLDATVKLAPQTAGGCGEYAEKALKELQEGMEVAKVEARRMGEEKEATEAKCKELRAGFTVEKEALTEDYQKQVDEMFFYGYQCCMRKNDTQDVSTYPSDDEENTTINGPAQGDKDPDASSPSTGQ
ncbi:hypothetical protein CK203_100795 [Vitis vinifera]|uniref:Uncharacterized protein n=1 Tax=Vitis vinifera TaxID=29760 RepID=A0A438CJI0_VITVI|nr:hypothetical protein CK203_100795 [Vitis vinifera]